MSPPTDGPAIAVRLDAVEALAAELSSLACELVDEAALCRSATGSLHAGLSGDEGWSAGSAATTWAALAEVVGARSGAVAGTLASAVAAYRAADAALAQRLAFARSEKPGGSR
jgi:hypothetical protein